MGLESDRKKANQGLRLGKLKKTPTGQRGKSPAGSRRFLCLTRTEELLFLQRAVLPFAGEQALLFKASTVVHFFVPVPQQMSGHCTSV